MGPKMRGGISRGKRTSKEKSSKEGTSWTSKDLTSKDPTSKASSSRDPTEVALAQSEIEGSITVSEDISDTLPMQPLQMFHPPSKYNAVCKIQTRCDLATFLTMIEAPEFKPELEWFKSHPQFKHLFHMEREANLKLQGLFMLLVRTVSVDKKTNLWFVVNGIPIRYSLREHGLISGFYCHEYSETVHPNMKLYAYTCKFKQRQFPKKTSISVKDVKDKLLSMKKSSSDRLSMMILYFLSAVLPKKAGVSSAIDPFFFRMAEDLDLCRSFPWGRMTFDDSVRDVYYLMGKMEKMTGAMEEKLTLPGFVIPLEVLAFECIPNLRSSFRVGIKEADEDCPRMCKRKFRACSLKGWPVEEIYNSLGSTKDIHSILEPEEEEKALCARIFDDDLGYDAMDMLPDSWSQHLQDNKKICWEKMYEMDVDSRKPKEMEQEEEEIVEPPESAHGIVQLLKEMEKRLTTNMKEGFDKLKSEIEGLEKKVLGVSNKVKDLEDEVWRGGREDGWDFDFKRDEGVEVTGAKGEEGEKGEKEGEKTEDEEKGEEGEKTEEEEKGEEGEKIEKGTEEEEKGEEGEKIKEEEKGEEGEQTEKGTEEEEKGEKGEEEEETEEKGEEDVITYVVEHPEEETEMAMTLFSGAVTYPPVITEIEFEEEEAEAKKKKQKTGAREKKLSVFKRPPYTADGKRRTTRNATTKENDGAVKAGGSKKAVGTKRKKTGDGVACKKTKK